MNKHSGLCIQYLVLILTITSCNKKVLGEFHSQSGISDVSTDLGNGNNSNDIGNNDNGTLNNSTFNGGWGSEFTDSTKADHFQYSFKLCNNPIPSNGGEDCVAESGYTVVANTFPLRAEKKLNSCVIGFNLINGACVAPINGAWGSTATDNSKDDHFKYYYKLCNNPSPQNGGLPCAEESNYSIVIGSSPLREEQKTDSCISGYGLVGDDCIEIKNGGWSTTTYHDYSKPDHFVYDYKLCNAPLPQAGGANCTVENGYTLITNTSPIKEEIKTNACVSGYTLVGSTCSLLQNGAWGNTLEDLTKNDHFKYEYKLCNSPAPSNGGNPCTTESGFTPVANSSPQREEKKLSECISGYLNVDGACVQDIMGGRTSITTVVGGGTCKPQHIIGQYNAGCLSWNYWGAITATGDCPPDSTSHITGYISAGPDGFICTKTAHLTASGWDAPLNIPVGGATCRPAYDAGTSCGDVNNTISSQWLAYGLGVYTENPMAASSMILGCPANTFQVVTGQVMGGPTGFLCLTTSTQVNGQWTVSSEYQNNYHLRNITGGRYCQPAYDGVYYGGGSCPGAWTEWGSAITNNIGVTGQVIGGPNGLLIFEANP